MAGVRYWIIVPNVLIARDAVVPDPDHVRLATSHRNAEDCIAIDLTTPGSAEGFELVTIRTANPEAKSNSGPAEPGSDS